MFLRWCLLIYAIIARTDVTLPVGALECSQVLCCVHRAAWRKYLAQESNEHFNFAVSTQPCARHLQLGSKESSLAAVVNRKMRENANVNGK